MIKKFIENKTRILFINCSIPFICHFIDFIDLETRLKHFRLEKRVRKYGKKQYIHFQ